MPSGRTKVEVAIETWKVSMPVEAKARSFTPDSVVSGAEAEAAVAARLTRSVKD